MIFINVIGRRFSIFRWSLFLGINTTIPFNKDFGNRALFWQSRRIISITGTSQSRFLLFFGRYIVCAYRFHVL